MSTVKFSKDHEWIAVEGGIGTVGITDYAQKALGDVVFVELPQTGATYSQGDEAAVVESVKAASEIYSPVSGEVVEVNATLESAPDTVNGDPMGDGWFFKIKIADTGELDGMMTAAEYDEFVAGLE